MTYKNIILDDSVLDIDSWLPQGAIDEIVEIIKDDLEKKSSGMFDKNNSWKSQNYKLKVRYKDEIWF